VKPRTLTSYIVGFVLAAHIIYAVLKFVGAVGNDGGEVPTGLLLMIGLLVALLLLARRGSSALDQGRR
jgi:ABC-type transporter Mla maintaining outer membrane lipid asymmetry permease subunit MlaE